VVYEGDEIKGFVCTCRYSFALSKVIGLALVQSPLEKQGSVLQIYQNDGRDSKHYKATVVSTPFYDPEGKRLRM
jgi:glycine cleavage system aminomethyltransferase T